MTKKKTNESEKKAATIEEETNIEKTLHKKSKHASNGKKSPTDLAGERKNAEY